MTIDPFQGAGGFWRNVSLAAKGSFVIGFPLAALILGFSLFSVSGFEERAIRRDLAQTLEFRETLGSLLRDLFSMESAARGYALSQWSELRPRYWNARTRATVELEKLDRLWSNDAGDHTELATLHVRIEEKFKATEDVVGKAFARPVMMEPLVLRSVAAMQRVEEAVRAVDEKEASKERLAMAKLDQARARTVAVGSVAMILSLLLSLGGVVVFARLISRRLKALQVDARALKTEAPLVAEKESWDEIGQLRSELERSSEILAQRMQALRESEAQLQAIIDGSTAVIYMKDLESRFLLVNSAYEKSFGLKASDALGRTPVEIFGPDIGEKLRANDLAVMTSKRPAQFEESIVVTGKCFTYLSVKSPLYDAKGEVYGICGVSTDITDRVGPVIPSDNLLSDRSPFPVSAASVADAQRQENRQERDLPLGCESVLLVEDDEEVRELEALLLRTLGYAVQVAQGGQEAEEALADRGGVDLVVTDYKMPRMNGLELINRIERRNPKTKFILTSGAQIVSPGAERFTFLQKPFEIKELASTVRNVLNN